MQEQGEETSVIFRFIYHVILLVIEMLVVLLVLSVIASGCRMTYQFYYEVFGSVTIDRAPGRDIEFQIRESDTMFQVAKRLSEEGLVVSPYSFYARVSMMERGRIKLYPGSYLLNTAMDYEDIIDRLAAKE